MSLSPSGRVRVAASATPLGAALEVSLEDLVREVNFGTCRELYTGVHFLLWKEQAGS